MDALVPLIENQDDTLDGDMSCSVSLRPWEVRVLIMNSFLFLINMPNAIASFDKTRLGLHNVERSMFNRGLYGENAIGNN